MCHLQLSLRSGNAIMKRSCAVVSHFVGSRIVIAIQPNRFVVFRMPLIQTSRGNRHLDRHRTLATAATDAVTSSSTSVLQCLVAQRQIRDQRPQAPVFPLRVSSNAWHLKGNSPCGGRAICKRSAATYRTFRINPVSSHRPRPLSAPPRSALGEPRFHHIHSPRKINMQTRTFRQASTVIHNAVYIFFRHSRRWRQLKRPRCQLNRLMSQTQALSRT